MVFWDGSGAHFEFWQAALMWVGMLLFWGLFVWGIYVLVTNLSRRPGERDGAEDPRRILDQRLARGEITPEEYERLRSLLSGRGASGAGTPPADRAA